MKHPLFFPNLYSSSHPFSKIVSSNQSTPSQCPAWKEAEPKHILERPMPRPRPRSCSNELSSKPCSEPYEVGSKATVIAFMPAVEKGRGNLRKEARRKGRRGVKHFEFAVPKPAQKDEVSYENLRCEPQKPQNKLLPKVKKPPSSHPITCVPTERPSSSYVVAVCPIASHRAHIAPSSYLYQNHILHRRALLSLLTLLELGARLLAEIDTTSLMLS
jgi:hypothetical protein